MYVYVYASMYLCMYACMCVVCMLCLLCLVASMYAGKRRYVGTYVFAHVRTYLCLYVRKYACMHGCMYVMYVSLALLLWAFFGHVQKHMVLVCHKGCLLHIFHSVFSGNNLD